MESFLTQAGYAAVFLFGFLEACCVPIPSEVTFGFAGVLAGEGKLNIVAVIVIGTLAELMGSLVSYSIGRVGGRPLVHRFGRYLLITRSDIDRAERFLAGRGAWAVPVARALPIVRTFASIVAGIIEIPPVLFAFLSLVGTAIWVTVIALIGYAVGSAWSSVAHGLAVAGYAIALVAVIAIVVFVMHRRREFRMEAAEAAHDQGYDPGQGYGGRGHGHDGDQGYGGRGQGYGGGQSYGGRDEGYDRGDGYDRGQDYGGNPYGGQRGYGGHDQGYAGGDQGYAGDQGYGGYGGQGYGGQGYGGQGYGGQDYSDRSQGYGGQDYSDRSQGYGGRSQEYGGDQNYGGDQGYGRDRGYGGGQGSGGDQSYGGQGYRDGDEGYGGRHGRQSKPRSPMS